MQKAKKKPYRINHATQLFGKRLMYFRIKKKLSRRRLAVAANVSHITIMLVEKGEVEPHLITAFKLAEALDFKFDDLRDSVL